MKRFASFSFILVVMVLMVITASPSFAAAEFCWKDADGRGVGTVPRSCGPGKELVGLFCYDECPKSGSGMKRAGIDCHSICPDGMTDQGLFCRAPEYGRGSGYPWTLGDSLNLNAALSRCEAKEGTGKCEPWGAVIYPKCKEGYSNFGCCICRPATPDCQKLGLKKEGQVDLSCAKEIKIASPPEVGICGDGQEGDAGLCYKKCPVGYYGVGPVCWKAPPWGWVDCGMGAAKDAKTCASIILSQVGEVGRLAVTVATLGASMVASEAAGAPANASKFAQLKQQYDRLVALYDAAKKSSTKLQNAENLYSAGTKAWGVKTAAETALNVFTEADIARLAAQIAAIVDSSGVSGVTAAYTYDKCSKLFPDQGAKWVRLNTERFTSNKLTLDPGFTDNYNLAKFGSVLPDGQKTGDIIQKESWRAEPQRDGTVLLKSAFLGPDMCLGIIPDGPVKNQPQLQKCSDDPTGQPWKGQHWKFVQDGDWMQLKTLFSGDGKCLGTISTSAGPKAPVQYWPLLQPCGANPNYPSTVPGQHWRIHPSPYTGPGAGGWTP